MPHYELSVELAGQGPTRKRFCIDATELPSGGDTITYQEDGKAKTIVLPNGQASTKVDACTRFGTPATWTKKP